LPTTPTNERSRRTRAALLAAVREILEEDGFEALSMEAVADRANVTRKTVYLHFESRADLLSHVFSYVAENEELAASLEAVWSSASAADALRGWAKHIARYYPRVLRMERAITRARYHGDESAQAYWSQIMASQYANTQRLARWLQREGRLRECWTVNRAADMLWALTNSAMLERLLNERRWSKRYFEERFGDLLLNAFIER